MVLQSHVRTEISSLLIPLRDEVVKAQDASRFHISQMADLTARLDTCETYCRIEHRKKVDKEKKMNMITGMGASSKGIETPVASGRTSPPVKSTSKEKRTSAMSVGKDSK
jgi:hypothetical protein